jgi:type III secretion protein R
MTHFDPITLVVVLALLSLVPLAAVMMTSFLKIAIVLSLVRNALGVQQVPPNMALYGLALILSAYVMAPVIVQAGHEMQAVVAPAAQTSGPTAMRPGVPSMPAMPSITPPPDRMELLLGGVARAAEPLRAFMLKNSQPAQRDFFVRTAHQLWGPKLSADVKETDFLVLIPSFLVSELTAAFQIGFLLYLPFVVIDIIVSNILLAMGMMMVSPVTISMPLKLFLFVMVDGWTRLIQGLVLSYR